MAGDVQRCQHCGGVVPEELGQHLHSPLSGQVTCPHCGEAVELREGPGNEPVADVERATAAPPGRSEADDSFSGSETAEGVAEELDDKPS